MKQLLFLTFFAFSIFSNAQYIAVKARYTETRLIPNPDPYLPDSRENRLILSFYEYTAGGTWVPAYLSNYDIWIEKAGLQYGSEYGGVADSAGNNYPGYSFTAPRAVSYSNTLGLNFFDCLPAYMTHYTVNGQELDCGFISVSFFEYYDGGPSYYEVFTAPNIGLSYYTFEHPYYWAPGNVNFTFTCCDGPPYNLVPFNCGGPQQLIRRGVLPAETAPITEPLPVRFAGVRGELSDNNIASLFWSNMTESDLSFYEIQRAADAGIFQLLGTIPPTRNDGGRADYQFESLQLEEKVLYRIKAVENSGRVYYSPIIALTRPEPNSDPAASNTMLSVYPNPTSGVFRYNLASAEKGRYIIFVVDGDGKQLRQKLVMHNGGDMSGQLDLSGLPTGIYQLVLRGERSRYTEKILYVR